MHPLRRRIVSDDDPALYLQVMLPSRVRYLIFIVRHGRHACSLGGVVGVGNISTRNKTREENSQCVLL